MNRVGFIYKTTNLINGKIYIGQHIGKVFDSYLGSGSYFLNAVKKYGKENFKREILRYCYSQHELDIWEMVMIRKYNATDKNIGYNILPGTANEFGSGSPAKLPRVRKKMSEAMSKRLESGWRPLHYLKEKDYEEHSKFMKEYYKTHEPWNKGKKMDDITKHPMYGKHHSEESRKKMKEHHADFSGKNNPMYGVRLMGKDNPAFGKMWITNGVDNLYIKKDEPIPQGYYKGMIRKKKI